MLGGDARLVLLNALGAAEEAAEVPARTACTSAQREAGAWAIETRNAAGAVRRFRARWTADAVGPWVSDILRRVAGSNSRRNVRLVKGSHIMVPKLGSGSQAYRVRNDDKRVISSAPARGGRRA